MSQTLGERIASLRKKAGLTQEELAEKLGISPQAVSKWENDISCPDIMTLPLIAELYGITIDELFKNDELQSNVVYEKIEQLDESKLFMRVYVETVHGDTVKVSLPYPIVKEIVNVGKSLSSVVSGVDLSGVDFESIFAMVKKGLLGEFVNVKSQNGDIVRVVVEK